MSINYEYKIIAVDTAARCMEIIYTAIGYPTQHIGARLPFEGESLEYIVRMYSPTVYWEALQRNTLTPTVGASGAIMEADEAIAAAAALAIEEALFAARQPTTVGTQPL